MLQTQYNFQNSVDSTTPPVRAFGDTDSSINRAIIALDRIAYSLTALSPEVLWEGFEETRQSVFDYYYGRIMDTNEDSM